MCDVAIDVVCVCVGACRCEVTDMVDGYTQRAGVCSTGELYAVGRAG